MKILGFSGRAQSGKNSAFNHLLGLHMVESGIVDDARVTSDGELWISDLYGNEEIQGIFDVNRRTAEIVYFLYDNIYPNIRNFSFADEMKESVVKWFGVDEKCVYGTNEEKNMLTHIRWEDMPGVITPEKLKEYIITDGSGTQSDIDNFVKSEKWHDFLVKSGPMTGREILQYFGTNIIRKINGDAWANATLQNIVNYNSSLSIITDVRFPNEVEYIQKNGGRVIRFPRNPLNMDHNSETALDRQNFDWSRFDAVLEEGLSLKDQNEKVCEILFGWNYIK